jgi:hypothetical protein
MINSYITDLGRARPMQRHPGRQLFDLARVVVIRGAGDIVAQKARTA